MSTASPKNETSQEHNDSSNQELKSPVHLLYDDSSPLYVFGYGSLVWKPSFQYSNKFVGYVKGFKRRFWQRCKVHRGTEESPGRVVTLVKEQDNEVWGVCYEVHPKEKKKVVQMLDVRERGGYTRHFVPIYTCRSKSPKDYPTSVYKKVENDEEGAVFVVGDNDQNDDTINDSEIILVENALLYVGSEQNSEYVGPLPSSCSGDVDHKYSLRDAKIIAHSVGPSGKNSDYLFNLSKALREMNVRDEYILNLEKTVQQIMNANIP